MIFISIKNVFTHDVFVLIENNLHNLIMTLIVRLHHLQYNSCVQQTKIPTIKVKDVRLIKLFAFTDMLQYISPAGAWRCVLFFCVRLSLNKFKQLIAAEKCYN